MHKPPAAAAAGGEEGQRRQLVRDIVGRARERRGLRSAFLPHALLRRHLTEAPLPRLFSPKADGQRAFVFCGGGSVDFYHVTRNLEVTPLGLPPSPPTRTYSGYHVLDCEFFEEAGGLRTYLAFDCLVVGGRSVADSPLEVRHRALEEVVLPRATQRTAGTHVRFLRKPVWRAGDAQLAAFLRNPTEFTAAGEAASATTVFPADGLILLREGGLADLKWKLHPTVDVRAPRWGSQRLYYGSDSAACQLPDLPVEWPSRPRAEGGGRPVIVEVRQAVRPPEGRPYWEVVGVRRDKVRPNGVCAVKDVLECIREGITGEELSAVFLSSPPPAAPLLLSPASTETGHANEVGRQEAAPPPSAAGGGGGGGPGGGHGSVVEPSRGGRV